MLHWRQYWALIFLSFCAFGAGANTCAPAAVKGTAPSDYQSYCWLDFTGYSDAQAQGAGQLFTFSLPDGSTLSLTLHVSTNKTNPALAPHAVPSWSGSAIGHSGFSNIPGNPVLYEVASGSTVNLALANIGVTPPPGSGSSVSYAMIAADGESSNQTESLRFTTNGAPWTQVAKIPNGTVFPAVSGVGTATVVETGVAGTVGSFAFASVNNPTQISAVLVGGGLQGPMFAVRYASLSVSAQLTGTRANPSDQFSYRINSVGGQNFATAGTTGAGPGPFPPATLPTVAAGYPLVISESMAAGSSSPLAAYAASLSCTNLATGASSTALPVNQSVTSFTFPTLQYGDALSCIFTNTANRVSATISKTGPATVSAGSSVSYSLVAANSGPADAGGLRVMDPAVANFTAATVTCVTVSGGAQCPGAASLTVANLQGPGIALPVLPSGSSVTLSVSGTAGNGSGNITNLASVVAPTTFVNTNTTPTSSATTTVTPAADAAVTLVFPNVVNAGQPVTGNVQFANKGLGVANGTVFSITVAPNLAAAATLSGLPAGAAYSYNAATGIITLTGMPITLAAGYSLAPIAVRYVQPGTGSSTVSAAVTTTTTDSNPANNAASVTVDGPEEADLSAKVILSPKVNAGQSVTGSVAFTNSGPSPAAGATYSLTLPPHLTTLAVSGLPVAASYSYAPASGMVTFSGLQSLLASGASVAPISFVYAQPATGTSTVVASAAASTADPNPANNKVSVTSTGAAAQLTGVVYLDNNQDALFDAGDTVIAGATVELLAGNRVLATTLTTATGAYTFTSQTPGTYTVSVTPLPGNLADTPSPMRVTLGGSSSTSGVGSAAPVANFGQIPAGAVGSLVLTKTTPLVNISVGQSVPYSITATNPQNSPVFDSTVTDLIPAGFRFRAGSGSVNGQTAGSGSERPPIDLDAFAFRARREPRLSPWC